MASIQLLRRQPASAFANEGRAGIIDIGSNSIRLVVYEGPARIPAILFNEKIMAGLGSGLARDGALSAESIDRALRALARFKHLADQMHVASLRTVATAAVREASNGGAFIARLHEMGLEVELLSGDEEAGMAGYGVLAAIPQAEGIVGDLGGGSLELARVSNGEVHERASFPLGVLRLAAIRQKGRGSLDRVLGKALEKAGWKGIGAGQPLYLVGGSWRALARLDMELCDYPLPILHYYRMQAEQAQRLVRVLAHLDKKRFKDIPAISSSRVPTLADAASLLTLLVRRLKSSGMIVSAYGLREGLLHRSLAEDVRRLDPLICAAREEGARQGRFPEHGDLLDRWIAPLFRGESAEDGRLRHAACLLADVGWRAHPDFRAERGLDIGLHGNWVGIDARGRAMLARALYTSFGGETKVDVISRLCSPEEEARADRWGLAMRVGQRFSGGVAEALGASHLAIEDESLVLRLEQADADLFGEAVERRLKALAAAFGKAPVVAVS